MKTTNLILIAAIGLALAGCQNAAPTGTTQTATEQAAATQNTKPVVDHGTPYTNGPTTAPDTKGPAAAPPDDSQVLPPDAQAVTTNENIRLTLPLKNQQ